MRRASLIAAPPLVQVLYSIPGADVTNLPTFWGTLVLNIIFVFGLLVGPSGSHSIGRRTLSLSVALLSEQAGRLLF